jgi:histidyl-tRNA synthetase
MRILDCKSQEDREICKGAPMMLDYLCDECRDDFETLKNHLDAMGIKYVVDPTIVRGLDYYTKTAFEFITTKIGAQGTVCGGGRYDHLIEEIGGPAMPGVGFGLGKERLLLLMEKCGHDFGEDIKPQIFISWIGDQAREYSVGLIYELRRAGIRAEMDTRERNLKGQMKYANKLGTAYTVVIGDDEVASGELTLKNMSNSEQTKVRREDLINAI